MIYTEFSAVREIRFYRKAQRKFLLTSFIFNFYVVYFTGFSRMRIGCWETVGTSNDPSPVVAAWVPLPSLGVPGVYRVWGTGRQLSGRAWGLGEKVAGLSKQQQRQRTDTDDRVVVTRGTGVGEAEEGKRGEMAAEGDLPSVGEHSV